MIVDIINSSRLLRYRGRKAGSGFYQTQDAWERLIGSDYINKGGEPGYLRSEIFSSLMLMDIHLLSTYRNVRTEAGFLVWYRDASQLIKCRRCCRSEIYIAITSRVFIEDDYRFIYAIDQLILCAINAGHEVK